MRSTDEGKILFLLSSERGEEEGKPCAAAGVDLIVTSLKFPGFFAVADKEAFFKQPTSSERKKDFKDIPLYFYSVPCSVSYL